MGGTSHLGQARLCPLVWGAEWPEPREDLSAPWSHAHHKWFGGGRGSAVTPAALVVRLRGLCSWGSPLPPAIHTPCPQSQPNPLQLQEWWLNSNLRALAVGWVDARPPDPQLRDPREGGAQGAVTTGS